MKGAVIAEHWIKPSLRGGAADACAPLGSHMDCFVKARCLLTETALSPLLSFDKLRMTGREDAPADQRYEL